MANSQTPNTPHSKRPVSSHSTPVQTHDKRMQQSMKDGPKPERVDGEQEGDRDRVEIADPVLQDDRIIGAPRSGSAELGEDEDLPSGSGSAETGEDEDLPSDSGRGETGEDEDLPEDDGDIEGFGERR